MAALPNRPGRLLKTTTPLPPKAEEGDVAQAPATVCTTKSMGLYFRGSVHGGLGC